MPDVIRHLAFRPAQNHSRAGFAIRLLDLVADWSRRYRERAHLASLPDHLIHDIGLSRSDIEREAGKPFWRD